jgi:hypothetical protein
MSKLLRRYAAWTRTQAGTTNCGHAAGAAVFAAVACVLSVIWVIHRYGQDILQVMTVIGVALLTIGGVAAAAGVSWCAWHVFTWVQHLRALAAERALPRCQDCPAPAPAAAIAVRQHGVTRALCAACWLGFVRPAPAWPSAPDAWAGEPVPAWPRDAKPMTGPLPVHDLDEAKTPADRAAEVSKLEALL